MSLAADHALFPGTFDPVTFGHLDLIRRSQALFGRVTVLVATNPSKQSLFPAEQRVELLRASILEVQLDPERVVVEVTDGLLVDAARRLESRIIVRGVRSGTDFDYEVAMARMNRALYGELDTVLLAPDPVHAHLSSTLVRQIGTLGGDISSFVPQVVVRAIASLPKN